MGRIKNEKTAAWSEKTEAEPNDIAGRDGKVRSESPINRSEQERINRESSSQSSIFDGRKPLVGGTITQLIDDYEIQLGLKRERVERLNEEIARESEEINRLTYRVEEFKTLRDELNNQSENT